MSNTLTSRQSEILAFIRSQITSKGFPPTIREIGSHMGIRSPNGVMCHLKALQTKGILVRGKNLPRAITLTDAPVRSFKLPFGGAIS